LKSCPRSAHHESSISLRLLFGLAHNKKRRPEDYWDAYFFCWAVKVGKFKRTFNIHNATGNTAVSANNFDVVRPTFGEWIEKSVKALGGGDDVVLVPVPSKDGVGAATTFDPWR
jgi:hypothetical protein